MADALINRREEAMDRADRAIDAAWPQRTGADYEQQMLATVRELETIASEMRATGAEPIEQSRTYRYLGSVYADLEPQLGKETLMKSRQAYQFAEALLEGVVDESEQAKLNFNYANTLRQLDPNDIGQLQEAERRFRAARAYFVAHDPKYLGQVDTALQSVDTLLKLAPLANAVSDNIRAMQSLDKQLAESGNAAQIAEKMQEVMGRDGGAAGLTGRVKTLVDGMPPELKQGENYDKVRQQLGTLVDQVFHNGAMDDQDKEIMSALQARLESDHRGGQVNDDRAAAAGGMLDRLTQALAGADESPQETLTKLQALRNKAASWIETLHYPSYGLPRPADGSRAAALIELCWPLRRYLAEDMNRSGKGQEESKQALDLSVRASGVDKRLYEVGADDTRVAAVELDELRPLTLAVRDYAARYHTMLARPIWSAQKAPVDPAALFYAGAANIPRALVSACRTIGLEVMPRPTGTRLGAARWAQLVKAMTTVFDMRVEPGPTLAGVTYELGIALTLGKPVVVITRPQQQLPFDIDIVPVALDDATTESEVLTDAIERSLVWLQPQSRFNVVATIDQVVEQYPRPNTDMYVDQTLGMLAKLRSEPDPVTLNRILAQLTDFQADSQTQLVHPIWQPVYSAATELRLFHVMPFQPRWAQHVSKCAEAAAKAQGVRYIRGDAVSDPDVIESIWAEIACASHILVDLTDFNPNVAFELGVAHTLGRKVLLLSQGKADDYVFPEIAKLRVNTYDLKDLDKTLGRLVREFTMPD
jgi:hypothetical protein